MLCFIAFKYSGTCEVTMKVKLYTGKSISQYRQTTNILWIHVLVLSLHIIWHEFLFVIQHSTKWFGLLNVHCEGSTIWSTHPHHNTMKHSIWKLPFIGEERRNVYEECSTLTLVTKTMDMLFNKSLINHLNLFPIRLLHQFWISSTTYKWITRKAWVLCNLPNVHVDFSYV